MSLTTKLEQGFIEPVATFHTYKDAEQAVEFLSETKFPVQHVSIVAGGLRYVERVTGRLTWGKSFLSSSMTGLTIGIVLGFFFGMFNAVQPLLSALILATYGGVIGFLVGGLIGTVSFSFNKGQRDFVIQPTIDASYYDIMVNSKVADEARNLLAGKFGSESIKHTSPLAS